MSYTLDNTLNNVQGYFSLDAAVGFWNSISPFVYGVLILILTVILARVIRSTVQKLLTKIRLDDHLTKALKSEETIKVSEPIVSIAYYAVWLFALPIILQQFGFTSLTGPINEMIQTILGFIPRIISSLVIFAVFFFAASALRLIVTQVLDGVGLSRIMNNIGLGSVVNSLNPSKLAGTIVFVMLMLIGATQSIDTLGLPMLTGVMNTILTISGNVLFGSAIIALGVFGANIVHGLIVDNGASAKVAMLARYVIIIFVGLTGVQQMGLETQIITSSAQILVGAIALGFAIAMGLGAKESIGGLVDVVVKKIR